METDRWVSLLNRKWHVFLSSKRLEYAMNWMADFEYNLLRGIEFTGISARHLYDPHEFNHRFNTDFSFTFSGSPHKFSASQILVHIGKPVDVVWIDNEFKNFFSSRSYKYIKELLLEFCSLSPIKTFYLADIFSRLYTAKRKYGVAHITGFKYDKYNNQIIILFDKILCPRIVRHISDYENVIYSMSQYKDH